MKDELPAPSLQGASALGTYEMCVAMLPGVFAVMLETTATMATRDELTSARDATLSRRMLPWPPEDVAKSSGRACGTKTGTLTARGMGDGVGDVEGVVEGVWEDVAVLVAEAEAEGLADAEAVAVALGDAGELDGQ